MPRKVAQALVFGAVLAAASGGALAGAGRAQAAIWPSAVRRAEQDLSASDAGARLTAVAGLAELPRAAARRLLLRALDDSDS